MNKPYTDALTFYTAHYNKLKDYAERKELDFVICPSLPVLAAGISLYKNTHVAFGSQDCSAHTHGNFTGQVDAQSLKQIGCSYSIIGHSERRKYNHETDLEIAQKCALLLKQRISPIICIGESKDEYIQEKALEVLTRQLDPLLQMIETHTLAHPITINIAYDPLMSIGTGILTPSNHLDAVFTFLQRRMQKSPASRCYRLLYGGSVSPEALGMLAQIKHINGFLIGKASLDFTLLEKIINYVIRS